VKFYYQFKLRRYMKALRDAGERIPGYALEQQDALDQQETIAQAGTAGKGGAWAKTTAAGRMVVRRCKLTRCNPCERDTSAFVKRRNSRDVTAVKVHVIKHVKLLNCSPALLSISTCAPTLWRENPCTRASRRWLSGCRQTGCRMTARQGLSLVHFSA